MNLVLITRSIPPLLWDVPTDTDYAMQLMADRVAKGQDLKPSKRSRKMRQAAGKRSGQLLDSLGLRKSDNDDAELEESNLDSPPTGRSKWMRDAINVAKTTKVLAQEGYSLAKQIKVSRIRRRVIHGSSWVGEGSL
jgi:hypothetical protein